MSKVIAKSKWVRISPRKLMQVTRLVRGMHPAAAIGMLKLMPQKGARVLEKVIKAAMANAKTNFKMDEKKLKIDQAFVNYGLRMRRFSARARGRGTAIQKPTSHITVMLDSEEEKA